MSNERAKFEEWWNDADDARMEWVESPRGPMPANEDLWDMWDAWQASRVAALAEAAKLVGNWEADLCGYIDRKALTAAIRSLAEAPTKET